MKYFINLSTRAKLFLSFGLIWLLFIAVIVIAYTNIKEITHSESDLYNVQFAISKDLSELRAYQNFNRSAILEMMLAGKKSEQLSIENSINGRKEQINAILEKLLKDDNDPGFISKVKEMKDIINAYQNSRYEEILLIKEGKLEEAQKMATGIQGDRYDRIISTALELDKKASNDSEQKLADDKQKADAAILYFEVAGIAALLFSIMMVMLLNITIAQPLNEISKIASRISSGELNVEINTNDRKDEVGSLHRAFGLMVEKLRGSLKEIIEGVNTLGTSASEILSATTQVASGSAETATAINETTTTVEEVRQAAQLSSQKAGHMSESAQQVAQITQTGQKAVEETAAVMNDIQNQMESVAQTIVRLSDQSQQIGGIVASVNDVADQTNLLAVNASIEAAKAGEQGKGFAVVAQEIKSLAQQSKQATMQVRTILNDVQKTTSAAVMATERSSRAVENGVKQSTQAGETIRLLSKSVNESVHAATLIVASSQQQVVGMDQIGMAMQNINQAGKENVSSMSQAEKAAKDLHELGQKLRRIGEQYTL